MQHLFPFPTKMWQSGRASPCAWTVPKELSTVGEKPRAQGNPIQTFHPINGPGEHAGTIFWQRKGRTKAADKSRNLWIRREVISETS
jgi:hypothetical protein